MVSRRGIRIVGLIGASLALSLGAGAWAGPWISTGVAAQTSTVSGRVVAAGSVTALEGITVELVGHGRTATDSDGAFRLTHVPVGGYTLNVVGFGFAPRSQYVFVDKDAALVMTLRSSPAALTGRRKGSDTETVTGRVEVSAHERRSEGGSPHRSRLPDVAEILTDQGHIVRTDHDGSFRVPRVLSGIPLAVTVRAFGYRQLEAVVRPGAGEVVFAMERDPQIQGMIESAVRRLRRRAVGHPNLAPPIERETLLVHEAESVAELIETDLASFRGRIRCVVVDDRQVFEPEPVILKLPVRELQRVELLAHPADPQTAMLRIYTRRFVRDMVGGSLRLASPQFLAVTRAGSAEGPPACR